MGSWVIRVWRFGFCVQGLVFQGFRGLIRILGLGLVCGISGGLGFGVSVTIHTSWFRRVWCLRFGDGYFISLESEGVDFLA